MSCVAYRVWLVLGKILLSNKIPHQQFVLNHFMKLGPYLKDSLLSLKFMLQKTLPFALLSFFHYSLAYVLSTQKLIE